MHTGYAARRIALKELLHSSAVNVVQTHLRCEFPCLALRCQPNPMCHGTRTAVSGPEISPILGGSGHPTVRKQWSGVRPASSPEDRSSATAHSRLTNTPQRRRAWAAHTSWPPTLDGGVNLALEPQSRAQGSPRARGLEDAASRKSRSRATSQSNARDGAKQRSLHSSLRARSP